MNKKNSAFKIFSPSSLIKQLLLFWVLFSATTALADALDIALQEIDKGHYKQAIQQLEPLASDGNAEAQYLMGHMLIDNVLGQNKQQKGVYWLEQAVINKHAQAAQTLSKMYMSGLVVPLDMKKGTEYLQLAEKYRDPAEPEEECD